MPTPDAIILAGGLGTRVAPLHPHLPKALIPFNGKPFIDFLFKWLENEGVKRIIIAIGYRGKSIRRHCQKVQKHFDLEFVFSEESIPLGTGGALIKASKIVSTETMLVMNGDTICLASLRELWESHQANGACLTILGTKVSDISQYGEIITRDGAIENFYEKKGFKVPGLINAGCYCFNRALIHKKQINNKSIEYDLLPEILQTQVVYCVESSGKFIDVGTPESLMNANEFFCSEAMEGGVLKW